VGLAGYDRRNKHRGLVREGILDRMRNLAKRHVQKALDAFHKFRKKLVTTITWVSFRVYATEVSWGEVYRERFKGSTKFRAPTLLTDENLDILLEEARNGLEAAEARRSGITDKFKILLTLSSVFLAIAGLMKSTSRSLSLRVGCVCAEKMAEDYVTPRLRERELRNRAARRAKWLTRRWKVSERGHPWIKSGGDHVVIVLESGDVPTYRLFINNKRGQRIYRSETAAKGAAFDAIEEMKRVKARRLGTSRVHQ
jgi:hypothetical protein